MDRILLTPGEKRPPLLKNLADLGISVNPRAPHADVTNAPHLFGDPWGDVDDEDGDIDYGDIDYGDPDDVDPLALYSMMSGDPATRRRRIGNALKIAAGGAAAYGGFKGGQKIVRSVRANRQQRIARSIENEVRKQSLARAANIRRNIGRLPSNTMSSFFSLKGAKLNSSPIEPLSRFVTADLKFMFDQQAVFTPFLQESASGTFAAGSWTCNATGIASDRFFTGLILQFGTNALNASPSTVITITASIPTVNGPLVISSTPILLTYEKGFDVRFLFFPWAIVSNKPLPVLGRYNNANPIQIVVSGIPAQSAVTLVVPGSLHPWTVAMRNALTK